MEMSGVLMKELGFKCSVTDHSVFYWRNANEHTIIVVTTDDMAVASKHKTDAERFKAQIRKFWEIADNKPISWFLGFEIKHDRKARTISIN
jgi:Reverse transcriptase (RNA-dependent DNA polymerase)